MRKTFIVARFLIAAGISAHAAHGAEPERFQLDGRAVCANYTHYAPTDDHWLLTSPGYWINCQPEGRMALPKHFRTDSELEWWQDHTLDREITEQDMRVTMRNGETETVEVDRDASKAELDAIARATAKRHHSEVQSYKPLD